MHADFRDSDLNGAQLLRTHLSQARLDRADLKGAILTFSANDGVNGGELWVTDGTESGTYLVSDINKGSGDSSPRSINDLYGTTYFSAETDQYGRELWRLDDNQKKAARIVSSGAGKKKLRALEGNA